MLGRKNWRPPYPHGPDGWVFDNAHEHGQIIVSVSDLPDDTGIEWVHASIAFKDRMPTYDELCLMHRAVYADHYAYQVFAPAAQHINIHHHALHLWGRLDGEPMLPEFGRFFGSI